MLDRALSHLYLLFALAGCAGPPPPQAEVSATFSIVAVDPEAGVCGAAVASKYPAVGKVVPYVRAGVGAFCTQHWHKPEWGPRALDLLAAGKLPEEVLADLLRDDPDRDKRQLAIIDRKGRAASRNPADADPSGVWWGAMSGKFYSCQGNTLAGREVIAAMAKAYEETRGSLADRLVAALVAGDLAGGDHRGRLATGIRVAKAGIQGDWLALDVDRSDDAVRELAREYERREHPAKGSKKAEKEPPPFWKGRVEEIEAAVASVKTGKVRAIARSPGGRPVQLIEYGERTVSPGTANYGSAAGAGDPGFYARKPKGTPPAVFIVGPPHGHEVEGMVGLVNLLRVAETGADLRGKDWPRLREGLRRSRALIVPLSNPDGRARCPYESFIGIPADEMARIGQGTRKDGTLYGWPGVKQRHPMKDDVGFLGAYFNDDGVNLMHDEFFAPMAEETRALLAVAREEAPDFILILHSHGQPPQVLPTSYVPRTQKEAAARFGKRLRERYLKAGLPAGPSPVAAEDGEKYPPPSFNLTSALHHICGGVAMVFECPHGLKETLYPQVTHDQILDIELILLEELFAFALEEPRPEMPGPPADRGK